MIAPIGMFDLSSTLTLTTSVKCALNPFKTSTKTFHCKDTNSSNDGTFFDRQIKGLQMNNEHSLRAHT
jgi:hypothetical protein